jgi:hypothetical protein
MEQIDDDSITISSLNSEQKQHYKTRWPTQEEIEKLLGIKFKIPEIVKPVEAEIKSETESAFEDKSKEKFSNKSKSKKSASGRSASQKSASLRKASPSEKRSVASPAQQKKPASPAKLSRSPSAGTTKGAKKADKKKNSQTTPISETKALEETFRVESQILKEPIKEEPIEPINQSHMDIVQVQQIDNHGLEADSDIFKLPNPICPSSIRFSKKLGVKLWIQHSDFNACKKTVPLA